VPVELAFIDRPVLATANSPHLVCVSRLLAWITGANLGELPAGRPRRPAMSEVEEGADALLMDGRIIHVRPVSEGDKAALSALYTRASPRSRYLRFFSAGISIDREVQRLVEPEDDHVALVAEHDGVAVGVASYEILNGTQAEIALLVDDAWQGDGIGSLLIEHLAAVARRAGIQELVGDVLATNVTMLRTSASLAPGIARQHGEDPGVVRVRIPTQPDERALAAAGYAIAPPNTIHYAPC
jgi:GNAT superfamily N-acetyltransferase